MPRKGPARRTLTYRDHPDELAALRSEAKAAGLTQTDYLLQLIAWGREHMPRSWPLPAERVAPKPGLSFRDLPATVDELTAEARAAGFTREQQIARLISYSRQMMPADAPVPEHPRDRRRGKRFAPVASSPE